MKILFGNAHYGKDTSECPSGFLIWIIEEYDKADWSLVNACKKELATRLKLDWVEPDPNNNLMDVITNQKVEIRQLKAEAKRLLEGKIMFEKIAWVYGVEPIDFERYAYTSALLDSEINDLVEDGMRRLPYIWTRQPFVKQYFKEERKKDLLYLERLRECKTIEDLNNLKREAA